MLTNCQINTFKLTSQIGSGAYGLVFHALDIITENEYAIKAVVKSKSFNEVGKPKTDDNIKKSTVLQTQLYHFFKSFQNRLFLPNIDLDSIENLSNEELARAPHYKEIALHLKVHSHENICTIHQVLESPLATFIVMDYYRLDLFTAIVDMGYFMDNGLLIKKVFLQLCSALEHCHHNGVFHCDIKPENVLLDCNDDVHLCDFGLSTTRQYLAPNICIGSSYYMAPERILYCSGENDTVTSFPTSAGDVWSLGIILINLCCIRNPWLKAHQTKDSTFNFFAKNSSVLKQILPISNEFYELLIEILQINPYHRTDLKTLMHKIADLMTFTTEGPLSSVPRLDANLYETFIAGDKEMRLKELLSEEKEYEMEADIEEDGCISEIISCESDEEWTKGIGYSLFMQWAGNNLSTLTNFSYQ